MTVKMNDKEKINQPQKTSKLMKVNGRKTGGRVNVRVQDEGEQGTNREHLT